jgi:prefoldin subunit 5
MNNLGFFDEAATVGAGILEILGGSTATPAIKRYLEIVGRIYQIMSQIHDSLAEVAIDVSLSTSMDEASQSLTRLTQMELKKALKAQDLCDELEQLGRELRPLLQKTDKLSEREKSTWNVLCRDLEGREEEVANLYDENLYDLRMLPSTESSLESLKVKVENIATQLTTQKARFDLLAKKARAIRERLQ